MRDGEHDMEVAGREQVPLLGLDPSLASLRLALRAAARAARVIGDTGLITAAVTHVDVSAEGGGTAAHYSSICLQLLVAQTGLVAFQKLPSLRACDIGHFDGRPRHGRRGR